MKKILTNLVLICSVAIFFTSCVSTNKRFQSETLKFLDVPITGPETMKKKIINSRPDLAPANGSVLKGKPDICEFLNWAYLNYNDKFQYYYNTEITDVLTKKKTTKKWYVKGIFGGKIAPDPSKAIGNFLCEIWLNPEYEYIPKWGYPDFLSHPLMKNLWSDYGTLYSDFKNSSCNKPGFTEITNASEIGTLNDPNYEYCTFKDSFGKTKYFKKIKEKVEN